MKALKEKFESLTIKKAIVKVKLKDGTIGTITRFDTRSPLSNWWFCGKSSLKAYLDGERSVYELDNGRRVPICNIIEISPVETTDIKRTWRLTKYREWFLFIPCSYWGQELIKDE